MKTSDLLREYARVTRNQRCPVCGKPDLCLISRDGKHAGCARTEVGCDRDKDGKPIMLCHTLPTWRFTLDKPVAQVASLRQTEQVKAPANWNLVSAQAEQLIKPEQMRDLAHHLGVSSHSLYRLETGWSLSGAYTNPMRNRAGVIGIRLRKPDGSKFAMRGSQNGLFIPRDLQGEPVLFIVEGASDVAALLDMGFDAIGRPSCSSCVDMTAEFVEVSECTEWCIIEDHDEPKRRMNGSVFHPGQDGARKLAEALLATGKPGKLIAPIGAKDTREWKKNGATRQTIVARWKNASYFCPATHA